MDNSYLSRLRSSPIGYYPHGRPPPPRHGVGDAFLMPQPDPSLSGRRPVTPPRHSPFGTSRYDPSSFLSRGMLGASAPLSPFYHPHGMHDDAMAHAQAAMAISHQHSLIMAAASGSQDHQNQQLRFARQQAAVSRATAIAPPPPAPSPRKEAATGLRALTEEPSIFAHGFPPLDRGGIYPSYGSVFDPLSHPPRQTLANFPVRTMTSTGSRTSTVVSDSGKGFLDHFTIPTNSLNASRMSSSFVATSKPTPFPSSRYSYPGASLVGSSDRPDKVVEGIEEELELLVDDFDGQCCRTYPDNHNRIVEWRESSRRKRQSRVSSPSVHPTTTTSIVTSSNLDSMRRRADQPQTSPIPVGIAIGRQRTIDTNETQPNLPISGREQSFPIPSWPPSFPPSPYSQLNQWAFGKPGPFPKPPCGPIPMGYQLARDPITGHIMLIPTVDAPQGVDLWGRFPPQPPLPPAFDPRHDMLMHQQYFKGKMEQRKETETITVSDDDDVAAAPPPPKKIVENRTGTNHSIAALVAGSSHLPIKREYPDEFDENRVQAAGDVKRDEVEDVNRVIKEDNVVQGQDSNENGDGISAESANPNPNLDEYKVEASYEVVVKNKTEDLLERDECVDALLAMAAGKRGERRVNVGFDVLLRGIEVKEELRWFMYDTLCEVTRQDCYDFGLGDRCYKLGVDVICAATVGDYFEMLNYIDPLLKLKREMDVRRYSSIESEAQCRAFIEERIAERKEGEALLELDEDFQCPNAKIKSLEKVMKQIKNTAIMSQLEVELRSKICQLQAQYRERQSELSKLKITPKKLMKQAAKFRGPGRPRKGRTPGKTEPENSVAPNGTSGSSPPALTPMDGLAAALKSPQGLLRPPKLMAAPSKDHVTNLSTINARFMKGKANPFANLMKLATTHDMPKEDLKAISSSSEEEAEEEQRVASDSSSSDDEWKGHRTVESLFDDTFNISTKKRKPDKPKKRFGNTVETIVPKKPKNLFMNCLKMRHTAATRTEGDEYEFPDDEEDNVVDIVKLGKTGASSKGNEQPEAAATLEKPMTKGSRKKLPRKAESHSQPKKPSHVCPTPRTAALVESDLKDGLRILMLQEGRFWPSRLNSTQLPDVYGVVMEKQRGNRPQILPRDDILSEAILDLKPHCREQLMDNTRVCVYWSQAYSCLFPGTVIDSEKNPCNNSGLVRVVLDDGDSREVNISDVRLLPPDYSHVDYDPDPIASLRKRRVSSDSLDVVTPMSKKTCGSMAPPPPPPQPSTSKEGEKERQKCFQSSSEEDSEEDDDEGDLRVKLDGTFNNTTTYSIRSPIYPSHCSPSAEPGGGGAEKKQRKPRRRDSGCSDEEEVDEEREKLETDGKRGTNPVTGRPLWRWVEGDEGYRRPGSKSKTAKRKLFHRDIQRGEEILSVGDCAVFLSAARVDRPYVGRVEMLWETWNGNMMVKVKWFYHPEEIETAGKKFDVKTQGGLFQSPHTDENDVQTISHKCSVLPMKEYLRRIGSSEKKRKSETYGDVFYLAGSYDPTLMSVTFQPGVLKQ